jgi:hypothetical protein
MCIEVKRECMNLLSEFKHQIDDIGKQKAELERMQTNMKKSFGKLDTKIETYRQDYQK